MIFKIKIKERYSGIEEEIKHKGIQLGLYNTEESAVRQPDNFYIFKYFCKTPTAIPIITRFYDLQDSEYFLIRNTIIRIRNKYFPEIKTDNIL